ncbi:MAG: ribokinase [Candidatus Micrarchaeota archaeon]|nr:ribokinase [Candidatus Micrarchaeota archaeon]MDE1824404.1 ribokinase [Candidatus Micrarchaeota archaeon]MDE1849873.1 ribokinase [Candidatus Micrarchaeota archaeon]
MPRVIVAGSTILDMYVLLDRHPELGETLIGKEFRTVVGGKGLNTAVAASKLGADTCFITKMGSDAFGEEAEAFLADYRMSKHVYRTGKAKTGVAVIAINGRAESKISVVYGSNWLLSGKEVSAARIRRGDVLVGQLEIPHAATESFFRKGRRIGTINILNMSPIMEHSKELVGLADIIILNEIELRHFGNWNRRQMTMGQAVSMMRRMRRSRRQKVVVTLGAKGAVALEGNRVIQVPARKVKAVDTTGAGDCFLGALAVRIANGDGLEDAIRYANAAASISVQRIGSGTSMPSKEEVDLITRKKKS